MKTLAYLVFIVLFLFVGCAKDEIFTDQTDMNLKKAEMKYVPLKCDIYSVTTIEDPDYPGYGLPKYGYLVGNFSHLGKLIPEKSTWNATTLSFTEEFYIGYVEGQLAAANGDLLFYSFTGTLDLIKNEFTAVVVYNGGTGRFENCTGEADLTGYLDFGTGSFYVKVDGYITNVGSSK